VTDIDPDLQRRADEAGMNAVPAPRQILLDGWVLRFANGITRRANSVNPIRIGGNLEARIKQCAVLYAAQGQPSLFRVPSFLPPDLSHALDAQGYAPPEGETRILLCSALPDTPAERAVELTLQPTTEWLDAQARIACDPPRIAQARRDMLAAMAIPAAFGAIRLDGPGSPPASLAYIAVHDRLACVNMVATDPSARRRGLARRVLLALLAWAKAAGAHSACLQVAADNKSAISLYSGLSFNTDLYRYHYRRLDQTTAASLNCSAARRA
jgi:ribosomal protein S18 acetylase RimI-like enzyme